MQHYFINLSTSKIVAITDTNHVTAKDQLEIGEWLHLTGEVVTVEAAPKVTKKEGNVNRSRNQE